MLLFISYRLSVLNTLVTMLLETTIGRMWQHYSDSRVLYTTKQTAAFTTFCRCGGGDVAQLVEYLTGVIREKHSLPN